MKPEIHEFAIYQINQMGVEAVQALIETLLAVAQSQSKGFLGWLKGN